MNNLSVGWKVLDEAGNPVYGGNGAWPLPRKRKDGTWEPRGWRVEKGPLALCAAGTLHICPTTLSLLAWLGPAIFAVEYDENEAVHGDNKAGVLRARLLNRNENWDEQTARLFAADCAENDPRCDIAVLAARRYAFGLINDEAWSAVGDKARAEPWDLAWTVTWGTPWRSALSASRIAARNAAWKAAGDVPWNEIWGATWSETRKKQAERLHAYLLGQVDLEAIRARVA